MSATSLPLRPDSLSGGEGPEAPDSLYHRRLGNGHTAYATSPFGPNNGENGRREGRVFPLEPDVLSGMSTHTRATSPYQQSILSKKSKAASMASTYLTVEASLPALQTKAADDDEALEPLQEEELEPGSFDLLAPAMGTSGLYSLERRSELIFSKEHLQKIFDDPVLLQQFTRFLCTYRPRSLPLLIYYLDALKALRAINYANAVIDALEPLEGHDFTCSEVAATANEALRQRAGAAFEALARDDLPAYVTHVWIQTVSVSIRRRITGTLPPHLREMSEGLAEVFCLTDPSRHDNPIVFASEEFHRTTQYGMNYVLGRNCRFLQGPKTNPFSVKRIRDKVAAGKEHYETFLNYRRDGSPFMNLLMVAPLFDSRGAVRYFIGAQVDVSGLAKDCTGLESLRRLVDEKEENSSAGRDEEAEAPKEEIRELCEMFNLQELETVRKHGGSLHRLHQHEGQQQAMDHPAPQNWHKPRVLIQDEASSLGGGGGGSESDAGGGGGSINGLGPVMGGATLSGRLMGVYEHYLLVRPHPNLKILFASPSLRVPGILQSHLLSRIGGSSRVRDELTAALAEGHGVTAKVRWISSVKTGEGRHRWIHCTPLLGGSGAIGVWMVVITDDEDTASVRRPREAPPVDSAADAARRRATMKAGGGMFGEETFSGTETAVSATFRNGNGLTSPSSPYMSKTGDD